MNSLEVISVLPIALTIVLAVSVPAAILLLSRMIGPRNDNADKLSAYECGIPEKISSGNARRRFAVKFYLVALLFLLFDVEIVFLFPWAVWFPQQHAYGILSMFVFLGILFVGWLYVVRRGGIEWE